MDRRGVHAAVVMDLVGHDVSVPASVLSLHIPGMDRANKALPRRAQRDGALPFVRSALFITGAESHPSLAPILGAHRSPRD